jgi:signal peptidase I
MAAEEQGQSVSEGAVDEGAPADGPGRGATPSDGSLDNRDRGAKDLDDDAIGEGPPNGEPVAKRRRGNHSAKNRSRWWVELVVVAVVAVLIAFLLRTFVVATYSIPSASMEPTLMIGDRIVVDKLSYHLHGIGTGDIVVFSTPAGENCAGPPVSDLVKRVIALPGQTISLSEGRVFINGSLLPEPWLPPAVRSETYPGPSTAPYSLHDPYRVPRGDVFVMGDNRPESCDSRYWGPIRESSIVGKVDIRVWPLSRFGFF